MADDIKTLAQAALAATTLTGVYTVGAGLQAAVSSVVVTNRGATDTTFRLAVAVAGAADDPKQYLMYDAALPAHESWVSPPLSLDATDVLRAYAASANVTVQVFGLEVGAAGGGGGGGGSESGTFATRPAAGTDGLLYLPTDAPVLSRDDGAAWTNWGGLHRFTTPQLADFPTAVNMAGGATVTEEKGGIYLHAPLLAVGGRSVRARVKSKAAPYTITAAFFPNVLGVNAHLAGLVLRQSSDGKLLLIGPMHDSAWKLSIQAMTSETAFSGNVLQEPWTLPCSPAWLQLVDDNTNRIIRVSADGEHWLDAWTEARTTFLTADQVGFFAETTLATGSGAASAPAGNHLVSWAEA